MKNNIYAPPREAEPSTSWLKARPLPVYLVAGWCTLHLIGLLVVLSMEREQLSLAIEVGALSPVALAAKFPFPLLSLAAGMLLLFMRRQATYAFGIFLAWSLAKSLQNGLNSPTPLDLLATIAMTSYCVHLHRTKKLK